MQTIEIQKGIGVGFDEMLTGAGQMNIADLEKFAAQVNHLLARRKTSQPSERELELLSKIYEKLKPKTQRRYDELVKKLREENITDAEHQELLELTTVAERHNVEYLQALIELAQLRGVSLQKLMRDLGLNKRNLP